MINLITERPQDGEPIVEIKENAMSVTQSVPTAQFSFFLDEITSSLNDLIMINSNVQSLAKTAFGALQVENLSPITQRKAQPLHWDEYTVVIKF